MVGICDLTGGLVTYYDLLFAALLSRLNDPNREVRAFSIKALSLLELQGGASEADEGIWSQLIQEVFSKISLHLHDSDEKSRKLLLGNKEIQSESINVIILSSNYPQTH